MDGTEPCSPLPQNSKSLVKNFGLSYHSSPLPWTERLPFSWSEALERVIGWRSDCSQDPLSCHPFLERTTVPLKSGVKTSKKP